MFSVGTQTQLMLSLKKKNSVSQDLVEMLLRYTVLPAEEKRAMLQNLHMSYLNFQDLALFTELINSIDDFSMAVRFYTMSGRPLKREEFKKAAKICLNNQELPDHIVMIIFQMFDKSGNYFILSISGVIDSHDRLI